MPPRRLRRTAANVGGRPPCVLSSRDRSRPGDQAPPGQRHSIGAVSLHSGEASSCTISPLQPSEPFDPPTERLARYGVDALAVEELIALVLQSGQRGQNGLETARRLAGDFGSVSRLGRAGPEELTSLSGITPEQAAALVSCFRLARLAANDPVPSTLRSAADVADVATRELASATRERVIVLVCDAANHLRRILPVSVGSIDRAFLPVREILNAVLRHDGRAFAIAHNHPSGDPTPGLEDVEATDRLRAAAHVVGLRFLGHVVVSDDEWRSAVIARC